MLEHMFGLPMVAKEHIGTLSVHAGSIGNPWATNASRAPNHRPWTCDLGWTVGVWMSRCVDEVMRMADQADDDDDGDGDGDGDDDDYDFDYDDDDDDDQTDRQTDRETN